MMKASGGFGSRWMTDLIGNIVGEGCIPGDWRKSVLVTGERVSWSLYAGVVHLCVGHAELLSYWSSQ